MNNITSFEDFRKYDLVAKEAIKKFCKNETNRQRDFLYDWLNKELAITIDRPAYDYTDKRTDVARFECENEDEVKVVEDRIIRELKKKK